MTDNEVYLSINNIEIMIKDLYSKLETLCKLIDSNYDVINREIQQIKESISKNETSINASCNTNRVIYL